jgi:tetratricopeptide (TPR) repeat protein
LIVIAALAYPFIQQRQNEPSTPGQTANTAEAIPEVESELKTEVEAGQESEISAENISDTPEAWFEQGKAYYQAGQWQQAAAAFQKAIELDPGYQAAYANLGAAYHRQDKLNLAVSQYEKALELNPDDGEVVYNLAAVYIQQATQGGTQSDAALLNEAIEQLQRALELAPDTAEPYFGLGVAYTALNQREEAIRAFEAFLAQDSGLDSRASAEAQRYLDFLRGQ